MQCDQSLRCNGSAGAGMQPNMGGVPMYREAKSRSSRGSTGGTYQLAVQNSVCVHSSNGGMC